MTQQYDLAAAFVAALTGDPETPMDYDACQQSDILDPHITINELSLLLGVNVSNVWAKIKSGQFPFSPVNTTKPRLWNRADILTWLKTNNIRLPKTNGKKSYRLVENDLLECLKCRKMLQKKEFHKRTGSPTGYNTMCIVCRGCYLKNWDDSKTDDEKLIRHQMRKINRERRDKAPTIARARLLFHAAKRRAIKKNRDFDIDLERVYQLMHAGRCEVSGLPFDFSKPEGGWANPFCPSIDRKNSNLGYTTDNVQLVMGTYNQGKGDSRDIDFIAMCCAIAERHSTEPKIIKRLKELRNAEF